MPREIRGSTPRPSFTTPRSAFSPAAARLCLATPDADLAHRGSTVLERLGYCVQVARDVADLLRAAGDGVALALVDPALPGVGARPEATLRADLDLHGVPLHVLSAVDRRALGAVDLGPDLVDLVVRIQLRIASHRQVAFLQQLNRRLVANEDSTSTLGVVLDAVCGEVAADTATLFLVDGEGRLSVRATRGYELRDAELRSFAVGEGVVGWVVEHGVATIVADSEVDGRFTARYQDAGPRSMLVAPIAIGDRVVGAVSLVRRAPSAPFDDGDVAAVATVCSSAAIALENARLHEQERSLAAQLEQLNRLYGQEREIVDRLDEYERLYNQAVATVSHELKTPLMSIRGFAKMIADGDVEGEEARDFAREIHENAVRLSRYVERILEEDHVRQGAATLHLQPVHLRPLVEDVFRTVRNLCTAKHRLVDDVPEDLPPLSGDPDRVTRILVNLVTNAIKYSPNGGTVRVTATADDEVVEFVVEDEGIGVPTEARQRIFDRFYRVAGPDAAGVEGSGLGLAIVHSLVDLHGGRIWVDAPPGGRGSRFHVRLPRGRADETPTLSVVRGRGGRRGGLEGRRGARG